MRGFFQKVYEIVAQIPKGKVMTYGQIAALIGEPRGGRTVGWAMQEVPPELNLPCHRVVNRYGGMAPAYAFGGAHVQRSKLEEEEVIFKEDGCVDLEKHLWRIALK